MVVYFVTVDILFIQTHVIAPCYFDHIIVFSLGIDKLLQHSITSIVMFIGTEITELLFIQVLVDYSGLIFY